MRNSHVVLTPALLFAAALVAFGSPVRSSTLQPNERARLNETGRRVMMSKRRAQYKYAPSPQTVAMEGDDFIFTRIVGPGDPMPGLENGETFQWINGHLLIPGLIAKTLTYMNSKGHVGFTGSWQSFSYPLAMYVWRGGEHELIVKTGDPAPGTGETFKAFPLLFSLAPHVADDAIAFDGSADFAPDLDGVWTRRSGVIEKLFVVYDHPPGLPTMGFFEWRYGMALSGDVLVNATYFEHGESSWNNQGFFRDGGSGLEVVARTYMQAPGFPEGALFGRGRVAPPTPFTNWSINDLGKIAFKGYTMGTGYDPLTDEGVWRDTDAGVELVVREGEPVPGAPGAIFRRGEFGGESFGGGDVASIMLNDAGDVVFGAHLSRDDALSGTGLFRARNSSVDMLLFANRSGETPPGDPAIGFEPGRSFSTFREIMLNNQGKLAFTARVTTTEGPFVTAAGLWIETDNGIELVARPLAPAPGLPGMMYTKEAMGMLEFTDDGTLYYLAEVTDGIATEAVLYMRDPEGEIHPALMTGRVLSAGNEPKGVLGFAVGFGHSDKDEVAVHVFYIDFTEELFLVSPKSERVIAAQLDILPGACPNSLSVRRARNNRGASNPNRGGVVPVALLGSGDLDVRDVDVSSLRLEGASAVRHHYEDVAAPADGGDCACTEHGPDGHDDLVLKFRMSELAEAVVDGDCGDMLQLTLTGALTDGTAIEASDCVRLVGCGGPHASQAVDRGIELGSAVPNPFNPVTTIGFFVPEEMRVELSVYDVSGRLVERLIDGVQTPGEHAVQWNARAAATGVYFYRLTAGAFTETRKMILLK